MLVAEDGANQARLVNHIFDEQEAVRRAKYRASATLQSAAAIRSVGWLVNAHWSATDAETEVRREMQRCRDAKTQELDICKRCQSAEWMAVIC